MKLDVSTSPPPLIILMSSGAEPDRCLVDEEHDAHRQERVAEHARPQRVRHEEVHRVPCRVCVQGLHDRFANGKRK